MRLTTNCFIMSFSFGLLSAIIKVSATKALSAMRFDPSSYPAVFLVDGSKGQQVDLQIAFVDQDKRILLVGGTSSRRFTCSKI